MKNFKHSTAVIDDTVDLGKDNYIGPFCYLTGYLTVGDNNRFESHCSVGTRPEHTDHWHKDGRIIIGDDCTLRDHISIHAAMTEGLTRIGNCVIILNKAYVAHDCIIEDGVIISCGVKIGGHVHVMKDSNLGMGAAIHQYQVIGSWSMIGMDCVVPKKAKIIPGQTWVGNPVRRLKTNEYGLEKFNIDEYDLLEETARYKKLVELHDHGL